MIRAVRGAICAAADLGIVNERITRFLHAHKDDRG